MLTLAEKIEISRKCCLKIKDYIAEKNRTFYDKFFNSDWEVLVIKKDEETGEFIARRACCAASAGIKHE